jgi:hypothetical protein
MIKKSQLDCADKKMTTKFTHILKIHPHPKIKDRTKVNKIIFDSVVDENLDSIVE